MSQQYPVELASAFASIGRDLFNQRSVDDTLQHIARLAVAAIPGCDHCGVWVLDGGEITRSIGTDQLVIEVDDMQLAEQEGPCVDALGGALVVLAENVADDPRYPRFGPRAAEA